MNNQLSIPAEWEPHDACWVIWPVRNDSWALGLEAAKYAYANVIHAIAAFEPVNVIVTSDNRLSAEARLSQDNTRLLEFKVNDSWARDTFPVFVRSQSQLGGIAFQFNAWGQKFFPYDLDAKLAASVNDHLSQEQPGYLPTLSDMVLEGGSIHSDGQGTLLTTSECLLNKNRNPCLSQLEIEKELRSTLGVEQILWLPWGLAHDDDTDGHVDNIACFIEPGHVLTQKAVSADSPNVRRYGENKNYLEHQGDKVQCISEIEEPDELIIAGRHMAPSYINYYLANGAVIMPKFGMDRQDSQAYDMLQSLFPQHQIIAVDALPIVSGGGDIHCIAMQQPANPTP